MRSLILSFLILLFGSAAQAEEAASGQASLKETAKQARALFKQRKYPEAAALARQVFLQEPDGLESDDLRALLCKARAAGAEVGDPATVYAKPAEPASAGEGVQRPEKIGGPDPQFRKKTRKAGPGTVVIAGMIDQDGCVKDLRVERGLNAYADQDVLEAVRGWVFRPAFLSGRPVEVHYSVSVSVSFGPQ